MAKRNKKIDKVFDALRRALVAADDSLGHAVSASWELDDEVDRLHHCLRVIAKTAYVDERGEIMVIPIAEEPPKALKAHIKYWIGQK